MPTLRLITSSSQKHLLGAFADSLAAAPLSPLERETVVILSNGMARWISMELAARNGVAAGFDFCFPNDLLDRSFKTVLPKSPPESNSSLSFTHTSLTWRIATQLPALAKSAGFEQIAAYLGDGSDDRRLLQISRALADCFDQYTIFRPELVLSWDDGADDCWQAELWRAINKNCRGGHRAALLRSLQQHVTSGAPPRGALPRRISIFGISYLPPFHLEALRLLSTWCDITFYLLNPCGEYWGSIISAKKKSRLTLMSAPPEEAEEYYETGNPLLSSLGTLGQEFFETLLDFGFDEEHLEGTTSSPTQPHPHPNLPLEREGTKTTESVLAPSLLATIQHDILTLFDRPSIADKTCLAPDDRSIQIHSCHAPLREMEILYDNLLAIFDELHDLESRHIVVMIPDIESYAPYISSVFGSRSSGRPPLPFTIADRSIRRESPFIEAFLKIPDLASSRFALHEMLDFLESPVVMKRFDFDEDELITLRGWLTDCSVRWGLDADHRSRLGFPGYDDFSWQAGLDRLFLGYAMAPDDAATFGGILPYPACSGKQAETVGKLAEFIAVLRRISGRLNGRHTTPQWVDILAQVATELLLPGEDDSGGSLAVAKALHSLREAATLHGFSQPLALDAVRDHLAETLGKSGGGYGFMGGAITFCAMLPMRSIPMRVIWLAGMNDGQFPRTERPPGFSLMNGARRRGDRSLRDEDRYLFLEALMAAEDRFCISFTGQNNRDNSLLPPSVLVAELNDYITQGFVEPDGVTAASVLVRQRLQGFSSQYFDGHDPRLFSYDRETCHALEARRLQGLTSRQFIPEPLPLDADVPLQIDLRQLTRFFANPAAAFLQQRLKVSLFNPADEPEDSEPFALDPLARYSLSQELVRGILNGDDYDSSLAAAKSRGVLPPLAAGKAAFTAAWENSSQFAASVAPYIGAPLAALDVSFVHKNIHLHATLESCQAALHLRWRCATMKGKDRLAIWLEHLLLNSATADGYPRDSMLIASDSILEFPPLENAAEILADLLDIYYKGMQQPLRFFPETSWAFVARNPQKAETAWFGGQWGGFGGEKDNQAVALCFGGEEPWGDDFTALALRIYGPLMAAMKKPD
jgi:exodeoxyribonuclease V gamma subunit